MVVIEPEINVADTLEESGYNPLSTEAIPDTLEQNVDQEYGLLLTPPVQEESSPRREGNGNGVSIILSGFFILALIIALRYRDNVKYILAIVNDLMTTKVRQNVFDDTVKETSLLVLLNILWCASVGILGYCVLSNTMGTGQSTVGMAEGMLIGMAIAAVYSVFLYLSYLTVGWVFSDRSHSELWVRGFAASQALMAPAFFITALLAICCPYQSGIIGVFAIGVFIVGKLAFILKGYRIFFNQFSSWVLFLCYLCSLEIVPLVLCYRCSLLLG